jgi:alpha-tubulin suppressor-like RCC1 family protein
MPCHFGVIPLQPVNVKFTQVALKNTHALALSVDGKVYSIGLNTYGQLGRDG